MPRLARIVAEGYPHHVIQRGNNRQDVFFDDQDRELYLRLLKKYSGESSCKVKAYCLMSNHVHILLVPQHKESLAKTMQKLSLTFTQHINRKYKRTGRLWECRFHSCLVEADTYLWCLCRYIERNPVRSRMCEKPIDYKWSSARINTSTNYNPIGIEPIWKDYIKIDEYVKFLNSVENKEEVEKIKSSTYKGLPIGSSKFLTRTTEALKISLRPRGRPRRNK